MQRGRTKSYTVGLTVGTLITTVYAETEDDAIDAAIRKWAEDATDVFAAATFDVRTNDD